MKTIIGKQIFFYAICCTLFFTSCSSGEQDLPLVLDLNKGWEFRMAARPDTVNTSLDNSWMPATVPGTVHTDLLNNQKIEDPFYKDNEKKVQWVERVDWEYQTFFDVPENVTEKDNIEILFNGLDTYANVYLNDSLILSADNMFVPYQANVKKFLREGRNRLVIYFQSPVKAGMKKLRQSPYLVPAHNELAPVDQRTSVFTRKAPFHYGWDWGPRLVTSGIWRPVQLKAWNNAKIENVFVQQKSVDASKASLTAEAEVIADKEKELQLQVYVNGSKTPEEATAKVQKGSNKISVSFTIDKPKLWWSHGLGEPYLYSITTKLLDNGTVIDTVNHQIGVRKLELVQEKDSTGTSFYFKLNDVPVFMKGANYIPPDNFIPRVTEEKYQKVIKAATDANMNMLRVWGGAIYENDLFYNLCDRNGILVWQDFMFACSMMPEDSLHLLNMKREFDENIKRLRNHPSIALYCGNNENMVAWFNWGWKDIYKYSSADSVRLINTYRKVTYDLIANSVKTYDPYRKFWPSSPSSGYEYTDLPTTAAGDVHDWGVWFGQLPFEDYEKTLGRFVSEFGMQCFPEMKTIKSFSTEEDWAIRSPLFEFKQRSLMPWISANMNGNGMILEYVKRYYKVPEKFEDFVYISQLMQAQGLKTAIEAHRRRMPYCMGSLYWQIDDCWPTVSWASMDYYFRWKASHYAIRDAFKEVMVSPRAEEDSFSVYIVSDRLKPFDAKLKVALMDFDGELISSEEIPVTVASNTSQVYFQKKIKEFTGRENKRRIAAAVTLTENEKVITSNLFYFEPVKNLDLPEVTPTVKVKQTNDGYEITLSSDKLAKGVYLSSQSAEGFFSDNYFDLLPGVPVTITFTGEGNPEKDLVVKTVSGTY